jgi:Spy/CpxP family protein refolding chaperone
MKMLQDKGIPARPTLRRWIGAIALLTAVGAMAAVSASPAGVPGHFGFHGGAQLADMDPAAAERHIQQFLDQALADGTPEQKAAVSAIFKAALADLRPLHAQLREGHARAHRLLTAPAIDRAALEELRVQQMQQMDAASKRLLAAIEDAAEVLTPAQRTKLAEHMGRHTH